MGRDRYKAWNVRGVREARRRPETHCHWNTDEAFCNIPRARLATQRL